MPFREHPIPQAAHRWALPAFVVLVVAAVAVWVIWVISVLPGGFAHVTATTTVFLVGFGGIAVLNGLGIAVAIILFETTAYENRTFMARLLVTRGQADAAALPPTEEQGG